MAGIEELQGKIEGKLRMIDFAIGDSKKILEQGDVKSIERHGNILETIVDKIHELKLQVQELRMEINDSPNEVKFWTENLESKTSKYERISKEVKQIAAGIRDKDEEKREEAKRKRVLDEQMQLVKAKVEAQAKYGGKVKEAQEGSANINSSGAKLPKLVITKFQGTHLDWVRFWSQFETEIDRVNLTQVAKFSYLKELLVSMGSLLQRRVMKERKQVANAHMECIIGLPTIQGVKPAKIHEIYETLTRHIQTLETMGKIKEIGGLVRATLEKLSGIRADLVRLDDNWQEWGFPEMLEALRKWCDRNPIVSNVERKLDQPNHCPPRRDHAYQTKDEDARAFRSCVYCNAEDHQSTACEKVTDVNQRKKILSEKKLCFNCTGSRHRAFQCLSRNKCQHCSRKHHTSVCDTSRSGSKQMMLATSEGSVIYPVVVVMVDGIKCIALLDTGAGSSYASAALIQRLTKQPATTEYKRIDMMMCSTTQKIEIYSVNVKSIDEKVEMTTMVSKVDKGVLLMVPKPRYEDKINSYRHLEGVAMDDNDTKNELPIHLILGASEYSRIKTDAKPRIGEPIAELTTLGWTMMSAGKEANLSNVYLTSTSVADYEQLCNLDVLGLEDRPEGDQQLVYEEFKEQLNQSDEGWYETGLLWKQGHDPLPNNERGSIRSLGNLVKKLQREPGLMDKYNEIIQDQLEQGIVERVTDEPGDKEFYIPHKPVVKQTSETTKVRIVFDASARENEKSPSLNDCLETGPPLQNLLWDVLVRNRFKPIALACDIKQAFLQIRIRPEDRDVLRFHWFKDMDPSNIEVLRFTRALFGLVKSPFLLAGTLRQHLESLNENYPHEVQEILNSLYVDDIITGGETKREILNLKATIIAVFEEAKLTLHKWHSNEPELEATSEHHNDERQSFAKEQLGVKPGEIKMLGFQWNKKEDTLAVTFPEQPAETTKREMLRFLASVYDPLGIVSPVTLVGKLLYRAVCELHLAWDEKVSDNSGQQWQKFVRSLPVKVGVSRSLAIFKETVEVIDLHAFGDTSGVGTSAVVYAMVYQASGVNKG